MVTVSRFGPILTTKGRRLFARLPALLVLLCCLASPVAAAELQPFASDGCSLFPDGTLEERDQWCDCCQAHDMAYWQGGSEEQRLAADELLRDCVFEKTGNEMLAQAMYLGVRAGGAPAFPTWYRWGYGWPFGRGYQPLSASDRAQVRTLLDLYERQQPDGFCATAPLPAEEPRPANWAAPMPTEQLKNFYRLDGKVYRSAQPDEGGFAEMKSLGIENVLSLREYHSDAAGEAYGLRLHRVRMAAGSITTEQVVAALRIINRSEGPIVIHCWHGSDRTGMVSAMYRILFQGWSKEDAIEELEKGGYGYHGWLYRNIPEFIRNADVEAIREQVLAP